LQIIEIRSLIRELGQNHGVIFSTHILSEVQELCTDVLMIREGSCVLKARIADLPAEKSLEALFIDLMQTPSVGNV
jgi:ABC-2 type transport system ATP-binding protein